MWLLNKPTNMIKILFFLQIFAYLTTNTTAQTTFNARVCQDTFGNYTLGSSFQSNLNTLLYNKITSNTKIDYGFYNVSVGKDLDIVNGIGLCRPDILVDKCRQCLSEASEEIVEQCPTEKDAIGWYDECMIRYSDRYIFDKMELGPWYHLESPAFGVDIAQFNHTAATLLANLQTKAASGDSRRKYGAGTANVTSSYTIYGLAQCTPDLNYFDCYTCLDNAIEFALNDLYGNVSRVFFTSCNIRFGSNPFYDSTNLITINPPLPPSPSPPSTAPSAKGRNTKSKVLIMILVLVVTFTLSVVAFLACYLVRTRTKTSMQIIGEDQIIRNNGEASHAQMDFDTKMVSNNNLGRDVANSIESYNVVSVSELGPR